MCCSARADRPPRLRPPIARVLDLIGPLRAARLRAVIATADPGVAERWSECELHDGRIGKETAPDLIRAQGPDPTNPLRTAVRAAVLMVSVALLGAMVLFVGNSRAR